MPINSKSRKILRNKAKQATAEFGLKVAVGQLLPQPYNQQAVGQAIGDYQNNLASLFITALCLIVFPS
jgi:hypothetical protein